MLGAIIGDIVGSANEFSHFKGKNFKTLCHTKARFTDDTVCNVAVRMRSFEGPPPPVTSSALDSRNVEGVMCNALSSGSDRDSIATIKGSIAAVLYGIPDNRLAEAWGHFPKDIQAVISAFYKEVKNQT